LTAPNGDSIGENVHNRDMSRNTDLVRVPDNEWSHMIGMWLHGRPQSTCGIYRPEVAKFGERVGWKPIGQINLEDLQNYAIELMPDQKPRTIRRKLATVKSLLTFCHRTGLIAFNPGAALRMPAAPNDLAEKILTEKQVRQLIASEPNRRNKILLRVLYSSAIRASEAAGLRWVDVRPRNERTGQITVLGKGGKTRTIKLPAKVWQSLEGIRPKNAAPEQPVFQRADGGPMDRTFVTKIVARAAHRANIRLRVSSHWLRHAHASHSLARGAPLVLIQRTLGHTSLDTTNRYLHINPEDSSSRYLDA
jgi:integrase/recombinase XerD